MGNFLKTRDAFTSSIILCCFFVCISAFAKISLSVNNKNVKVFVISSAPPPGFKILSHPQQTMVDVYYGGLFVNSVMVSYTPMRIVFKNSQRLVNLLPGIIHKTAVALALSGELNSHGVLVCRDRRHYACKVLQPEIAGVIFDSNNYRVDIYVNKNYVKAAPQGSELLPPSSANLSFAQQVHGVFSGDKNNNSVNVIGRSVLGYKEGRINAELSYAHSSDGAATQKDNDSFFRADNLRLNELSAEVYKSKYKFTTGFIDTKGNALLTDQDIFGFSASTTLDTAVNIDRDYGSRMTVFLTSPSQISIFREGRLLTSKFYPAGNQLLDTSSLPDGAYDITLRIRSNQGVTREEKRFFVKTAEIPPLNFPQYYASFGWLERDYTKTNSILPKITNIPIYQAGMIKRMAPSWGWLGSLTGSSRRAFLGSGVFFIGEYYQIEPQLLFSTDRDIGVSVTSQVHFGKLIANLIGRKIWTRHHNFSNVDSNIINNGFYPITNNTTSASVSLVYPYKDATFSFDANVNKTENHHAIYSVGPAVTWPLWHFRNNPVELHSSVTKTQHELVGLISLNMSLAAPRWSGHFTVGQRVNNHAGIVAGAQLYRNWFDEAQDGLALGAQVSTDAGAQTVGASANYINGIGKISAEVVNHSGAHTKADTQYNASYDNRFVFTGNKMASGGSHSSNTGIVVDIKSKASGKFQVLANGRIVKIAKTNKLTPIFLPAFKTYSISIKASSKTFFAYDQTPKLVTLYRGNFKVLKWNAHRKLILFAKIIDKHGKPLAENLVKGGVGFNATDEEGYLQADVLDNTRRLSLVSITGKSCMLSLPKLHPVNSLVEFDKLVCR